MQMVGAFAEFEWSDAPGTNEGGVGVRPPGRKNRWAPAKTLAATTGGDQTHGVQGR